MKALTRTASLATLLALAIAGATMAGSGRCVSATVPWDFTLPDKLSFIPEMNAYSTVNPTSTLEYYRVAHKHRLCLNRLYYVWSGAVDMAPKWTGDALEFDQWDKWFAPLFDGSAFIPEFSPDGNRIVFNVTAGPTSNTMLVMDLESGEISTFANLTRKSNYVSGADGRARWFADGKSIAFIAVSGDETGVMVQDFVPGRDTTGTRRKLAGFEPERPREPRSVLQVQLRLDRVRGNRGLAHARGDQ